jgi:hypothetical protein
MFNFFKAIGHFFTSLFGNNGAIAQKVLHDASSFVNLALPIVQGIDTELKTVKGSVVALDIVKFLDKYLPDVEKAEKLAASFATLPGAQLWRAVATTALQAITPVGISSSLINLAVELAYNIFKQSVAPKAPAAT